MKELDIHDRITEAYYGLLGMTFARKVQQRINWIGKNVKGKYILDVGCSQGILAILLGREGKEVLGIDISQKSIDQANEYLKKEEESVQKLVRFQKGEFISTKFDKKFNTVVLAEILEHLLNPEPFIAKSQEILVEDGTIIVTVPFGINDYIDHKATYYFIEMYELLERYFNIDDIEIFDKWIAFKGKKASPISPLKIQKEDIYLVEKGFYALERELLDNIKSIREKLEISEKDKKNMKAHYLQREEQFVKNIEEITKKYQSLELKYKNINRENQEKIEKLKLDNKRLLGEKKVFEKKAINAYQTLSFRLGYEMIQAKKSWKKFFMLPFTVWELKKKSKFKKKNRPLKTEKTFDNRLKGCHSTNVLKDGITVIVPSFKGEKYIFTLLDSLNNQTFPKIRFEIIIVLNGEIDGTKEIVETYKKNNPSLNIKMFFNNRVGASSARNFGIMKASFAYILLIDDDDYVSSNYLDLLFQKRGKDKIVISSLKDVTIDGTEIESPISDMVKDYRPNNTISPLRKLSSILTMNGCKLIPTCYMQRQKFNTKLKSGEDVLYFTQLFAIYKFDIEVVKDVIYYRLLRDNSLSRRLLSFEFNVKERLEVIKRLDKLLDKPYSSESIIFIKSKIEAQVGFINDYLLAYQEEYERVKKIIDSYNLSNFPYQRLNRGLAKDLILSYCFTPYVDTSAIVMAKRVKENGRVVDVVYNGMDDVRKQNKALLELTDDLIENRIALRTPTSFSDFKALKAFCNDFEERVIYRNIFYERVYSRALWVASHFVGYIYKQKFPETKWIAEFSDPILWDIHGKKRYAKLDISWLNRYLKNHFLSDDNLFFWCEYLPYRFADTLIFTNKNQLDYMVSKFPIEEIKARIREKAVIKEHPIPKKRDYYKKESSYPISKKHVNLAYFGTFYKTRKLNDIVDAIKVMRDEVRNRLLIHIFTDNLEELQEDIAQKGLEKFFIINDYVDYFEFLNITIKMDVLIINDAETKPQKFINPYLPSKLSDYLGSGTIIWAIYEEGSVLSQKEDIYYRSRLSNIDESVKVLTSIVKDFKGDRYES